MDNDSNRDEQRIDAGKNTAHLLGTATATKLGGKVGGYAYNKLSQTKLGQGLETRLGNSLTRTPIANNLVKKVNSDINGKNDNKTNSSDSNSNQKLEKNKANRGNNLTSLLNKYKNRKKANQQNDDGTSSGETSDTDATDDNSSVDNGEENGLTAIKRKKKLIKMLITILGPAVAIIIIVLLIMSVIIYVGSLLGIVSLDGAGVITMTDNSNEQKYYDKLDEVVAKYQKSCGITINKSYIHTILAYPINNYDEFFGQEFDIANPSESEIDYKSLTGKVNTVAKLLVKDCSVDYDIDGSSYTRIKNSSFFKDYYKEMLKHSDADTILEDVFTLASLGSTYGDVGWFITDNLQVVMETCNSDVPLNGSESASTIGFSDYVMGVLYGELETDKEITAKNKEFLKAQLIAATSYALSRSGYQKGDTEIRVKNGNCWQLSCDLHKGCTYAYDLGEYGTCYTGQVEKENVDVSKGPASPETLALLQEVFDEVSGIIMLNSDGTIKEPQYSNGSCGADCMSQQQGLVDAQNGMSYEEILQKYYTNFTLGNATEDLYADRVSYRDGGYNDEVIYYNQNDYDNEFCGRRGRTIATSGCGTTAMAIVLSTLVDKSYDPVTVMEEAYSVGSCGVGISGTSTSFFKKSAKLHDLEYKRVSKNGDLQAVLDALESGNSLVIAHMGPGTFTRSGHYIVLARVNDKGKVYVYDPNKSSRNGWYDFNKVVVKELRGSFHIITKG